MKAHDGVEALLHAILTHAFLVYEQSASRLDHLISEKFPGANC